VYEEKLWASLHEDCKNVVDAVTETGQIFQIGHHLRYGSWVWDSIQRVNQEKLVKRLMCMTIGIEATIGGAKCRIAD
jgi:predicted dehydrogenase